MNNPVKHCQSSLTGTFWAYGISALRAHGMGESGVQFPVGPPKEQKFTLVVIFCSFS